MAVISFPTTCFAGPGAKTNPHVPAGEAIAQGEIVYKDPTTNRWRKAVANTTAAAAAAGGVALNSAGAAGSPLVVLEEGLLDGLTGLKPGAVLVLANVAGDVASAFTTDLTEDASYVTIVGGNVSATQAYIAFRPLGVQLNLV
jgi:hypothetical protein